MKRFAFAAAGLARKRRHIGAVIAAAPPSWSNRRRLIVDPLIAAPGSQPRARSAPSARGRRRSTSSAPTRASSDPRASRAGLARTAGTGARSTRAGLARRDRAREIGSVWNGPSVAVPRRSISSMSPVPSTGWPFSVSRQRPTGSKCSKPNPTPSMYSWHAWQLGAVECIAKRSRVVAFGSTGQATTDRRRRRQLLAQEVAAHEQTALHRRGLIAVRDRGEHRGVREDAGACRVVHRVTRLHAVELRGDVVEHGVVRGHQRLVTAVAGEHDIGGEVAGLGEQRGARGVVEVRIEIRALVDGEDIGRARPLRGELANLRAGPWIGDERARPVSMPFASASSPPAAAASRSSPGVVPRNVYAARSRPRTA